MSEPEPELVLPSADPTSCLYRMASFTVTFPYNVLLIVLVTGVVAPFGVYAFGPKITNTQQDYLPYGSEIVKKYDDMGNTFGFGQMFSYQLLMVPTDGGNFTDPAKWRSAQTALRRLSNATLCPKTAGRTGLDTITSVTLAPINGTVEDLPLPFAQMCCSLDDRPADPTRGCPPFPPPPADARSIAELERGCEELVPSWSSACRAVANSTGTFCGGVAAAWRAFVNPGATAMWAQFSPQFDPMDPDGIDWLHGARDCVNGLPTELGLEMYFVGDAAVMVDLMEILFSEFPMMIGVTCGLVIVFVGVAFRSAFIPLRAVCTIGCTLLFVFGFADLTYEHGKLDFTSTSGFHGLKSTGALIYFDPLFSFAVIVGLGLDYDTFLLVRIVEYRKMFVGVRSPKEATREAIICGVCKTAGIITAAGLIMAIAFFGLMLSKQPVLNQLSFFMVFAVLFDTFIVRTILVPACMSLLGELNWWPLTLDNPADRPLLAEVAEDDADVTGGRPGITSSVPSKLSDWDT